MMTLYVPVAWFGIAGLLLFPAAVRREQALFATMLVALLATILNIEANGTCQYGPRYLLPAMPLMSLGLIGFGFIHARPLRRAVALAVALCALVSFLINLLGALHGAMLCDFTDSAVMPYISELRRGQGGTYPLAIWLFLPFFLSAAWFIYTLIARRENPQNAG